MEVQAKEEILYQIRRINTLLVFFLSVLIFINFVNVYSIVAQPVSNTNNTAPQQQQDVVAVVFNNSITQMLFSTFIIAIVGVLITKLRNFRKKLDMIEVLTKAQVKFKRQSDERETKFEERSIKFQEDFEKQMKDINTNMDRKTEELERKIEQVKDEATKALIQYLRENSLNRKR